MSDEEFSNETLKRSRETVGTIYEAIVSIDGEVIDGKHRLETDPQWPKRTVQVTSKMEKILLRMHAHHRRKVSREETQTLILDLAQELEKKGIEKENIASELTKITPYSQRWILELLPTEYKKAEKVEAGKVSAAVTQQKVEAEKPLDVAVPCSAGCGTNTVYPKYWSGQPVCSVCYDKLFRGEISLEKPAEVKPLVEEALEPPRVEKKIYEPGAWREEMRKPVSRMDQWLAEELSRRGIPIEIQQPICIKQLIPEVIIKKGDKPLCVFLDHPDVPKTLVDMENRELLARRGFRVIQIEYEGYTEEWRQLVISEVMSAI